jgi:acetyltransferase-like isoleucine patch superfamily enzyme
MMQGAATQAMQDHVSQRMDSDAEQTPSRRPPRFWEDPYRFFALAEHPGARAMRRLRRWCIDFSFPAPRLVLRAMLYCYLAVRETYYFLLRVLICEPLFKAYCTEYGRHLHTGVYVHWISGKGNLIVGDDVLFDGKCSITFARRISDHPRLRVGNRCGINHGCAFVVAKEISIGDDCSFGSHVSVRDSNGHPSDPTLRRAGAPPDPNEVRPVVIEENVWIGTGAVISPGVVVGRGSIVAAHAVVLTSVAPYTVVAGNPARKIALLEAEREA